MHLHTPDGMFTGKIEHKGVTLAEGRGGMNFPAFFHDDMAFWASTEDAANSMADHLNSQLRDPNSDGKIRMMLVSSNIDKAFSSVDGTAYTTRILSRISELVPPEHKAEAEKLFLDSIKKAAKQTVTKRVKKLIRKRRKLLQG
jgi:fatty acid/phospholipid biosynthesis enzyme